MRKMATPKAFIGGHRQARAHDERRYQALKNLLQAKDKQIQMLKRVIAAKDKIHAECCEFIALMSHLLKRDNLKTRSKSTQKTFAPFARLLPPSAAPALHKESAAAENLGQSRPAQWPSALSSAGTTVKSASQLPPLPLSATPKPSSGYASSKFIAQRTTKSLYKTASQFQYSRQDELNDHGQILAELRTYNFENASAKEVDPEAIRRQIITKFCREDEEYARKKLVHILKSFQHLSKCNIGLAVYKQDHVKALSQSGGSAACLYTKGDPVARALKRMRVPTTSKLLEPRSAFEYVVSLPEWEVTLLHRMTVDQFFGLETRLNDLKHALGPAAAAVDPSALVVLGQSYFRELKQSTESLIEETIRVLNLIHAKSFSR